MTQRSAAQRYARLVGTGLLLGGLVGFLYEASFATGDDAPREAALGLLDVNGWHNSVHLASGALGLALAGSWSGGRAYALGLGLAYAPVTLLGFLAGDGGTLLGLLPVNTEDNLLHLFLAVSGVAVGLATPAEPAPTTAA